MIDWLTAQRRARDDRAFMPPDLAVLGEPAAPGPRFALWGLPVLLATCLLWAWLTRIEVVAVAPAHAVPTAGVKRIQAPEQAQIREIRVREFQSVAAGDVVLEFETGPVLAEVSRLDELMLRLGLDRVRVMSLLGLGPVRRSSAAVDLSQRLAPSEIATAIARAGAERAEYRASLRGLEGELARTHAEMGEAHATLRALTQSLPLVDEAAQAHQILMQRGTVPRVQWLTVERERISTAERLAAARARIEALDATLAILQARHRGVVATGRSQWLRELADLERTLAMTAEERAAARLRLARLRLTAPVAGSIHRLAMLTAGGMAAAGEVLMEIVPAGSPLEFEARIENRDVGAVHAGQQALIKLESADFSRHGHLTGTVAAISRNAIVSEGEPPWYRARVVPGSTTSSRGQVLFLLPGMTARVEVVVGYRRALDYLLGPFVRRSLEMGRER